ncbi:hypothetical protein ASPZODRAFT_133288 [Penicilliopsis zonata CBS 506.65]|uniref:Endoplasmic reticulum lectin n=1 Tax=Penicilliopsis zonata CBS 506.65 TaxID=1073090 RepID=A0A1L9SGF4_9EURO|nr:hypothetical protein ASPZODRAFT_133288 [Penicilliopsis zonata CBS 506.65]OJJ46259.1 hypothetical protein ASPZODRAFT_133288 [Penicilliopsis zonata CBS 506.65]
MSRHTSALVSLLLFAALSGVEAGKKAFNINDDILAYPQYQVTFPDEYVLESEAHELLHSQSHGQVNQQNSQIVLQDGTNAATGAEKLGDGEYLYEEMVLDHRLYLCKIPIVDNEDKNGSANTGGSGEADAQNEVARATERGLELLSELEGKCMYYVSGWWSYSFCYKNQIKQFHALPSGSGVPSYPPMEDRNTQSFILGRFAEGDDDDEIDGDAEPKKASTDLAELQTKGGSRYLVQHLDRGTKCDLTGRPRKVEVQFHCNPQSTDRIGWIKELTTCSYLMVIYTPRLCNDVAFQPQQPDEEHSIECREVLTPDEVSEWEAMQEFFESQNLVEAAIPQYPMVGDIEVGAKKLVGTEGRQIEKGQVASAGDEKVHVVAKRENGKIQRLSKEQLKKFNLDPERIEELKKQLEEVGKGKDWTLELVELNGDRSLRAIVDNEEDVDSNSDSTEETKKTGKTDKTDKTDKTEQEDVAADQHEPPSQEQADDPEEDDVEVELVSWVVLA